MARLLQAAPSLKYKTALSVASYDPFLHAGRHHRLKKPRSRSISRRFAAAAAFGGCPQKPPVSFAMQFYSGPLATKTGAEMICGGLMFDRVVSSPNPALRAVSVPVCYGPRLRLRPSLARSTISQSRDTKCKVDQGREIARIGGAFFCEGNQAIAPVSSGFGRVRSHGPFGRIGSKARGHVCPTLVKESHLRCRPPDQPPQADRHRVRVVKAVLWEKRHDP